jgi:dolichyl-phosphate-mannose--protein O-mannosyl transferase
LATYLVSWTGWFLSRDGYDRQWAAQHPSASFGWVPDSLRSLWHYHQEMYHFNVTLESSHPYQSNPWSWMVMGRPTAFFYESPKRGELGCTVEECSRAITALGTPVIWWGATLALGVLLFQWALRRDWRAGAVLVGLVGGLLPWFLYQQRTIYTFYAIAFAPWVVLSLTYALGLMLGPSDAVRRRRLVGALSAGSVVLLAVACFAWFYPIYVAEVIPRVWWSDRMWLPSWI